MTRHVMAVGVLVAMAAVTVGASDAVTPEEAIRVAVEERLGLPLGNVSVSDVMTRVEAEAGLVAQPEVTARLGKTSRFVLSARGVRRGLAVAVVTAVGLHPRAARAVARDEAIDAEAITLSEGLLPPLPIKPLLTPEFLIGLAARRNIAAGEALTPAILRVPPVIKSGDPVDIIVRIGAVSVTGSGIASGSGQIGEQIRVMQPHSSRPLTARIVGPGAVEIVK